jgi:hypothetical protein
MSIALPRMAHRQQAGAPLSKTQDALHLAALFGALALIAGIVFGTLSFRPF